MHFHSLGFNTKSESGVQQKARLVAKGFEEDCLDEIPKNSCTCDKQSLRLILSIIACKKWKINSMDIKTAFLQRKEMEREVYLKPPKEAHFPGKVWKLNKCVYGLADASLMWYQKVKSTLIACGGTMSKVDPAVFYWRNSENLNGIICVHVDDFLWTGSKWFEQNIISKLRDVFHVGKEACESFRYLGLNLIQENETIVLSQTDYAKSMKTVPILKERMKSSLLMSEEQTILRSKIGQLLWLTKQTRHDIAFDVAMLSVNERHCR